MTTQQARCVHDRPRTTDRCRRMGRKPHDAGRCGVRGRPEPLAACRVRQNGRSLALGNCPSGESRLNSWPWKAVQRPALPDPRERLLGAGEAGTGEGRGALVLLQHDGADGRSSWRACGPRRRTRPRARSRTPTRLIITDANATMRVHDRMPVILNDGRGPPMDRARPAAGRAAGAIPGRGDDRLARQPTMPRTAGSSRMRGWRSRWRLSE